MKTYEARANEAGGSGLRRRPWEAFVGRCSAAASSMRYATHCSVKEYRSDRVCATSCGVHAGSTSYVPAKKPPWGRRAGERAWQACRDLLGARNTEQAVAEPPPPIEMADPRTHMRNRLGERRMTFAGGAVATLLPQRRVGHRAVTPPPLPLTQTHRPPRPWGSYASGGM